MKLAEQALNDNNLNRSRELLDRLRPQAGEEDLRGWEWRHLWQRSRSDELFTFGRGGDLTRLLFSPDGRFLAARFGGDPFQLFDVSTRSPLTNAELAGTWRSMAFSLREPLMALAGRDAKGNRVLKFLSLPELKPLDVIPLEFGLDRLLYSGDGRFLVCTETANWHVKLWDVKKKLFVDGFPVFGKANDANATSADGQWLAVGSSDGHVRIYRIPEGVIETDIKASDDRIMSVAFSPDGRWIATSAVWSDKRVMVWEVATAREIARLEGHGSYVSSVQFLPDGKTLVTGGDQTIRFWDVPTQRQLTVLRGHESEVRCLSHSAATGLLASGGKEGDIKFWRSDARPSRELWTRLPAKLKPMPDILAFRPGMLAWSPDSTTFAVAEETEQGEEVVRLWDAKRMERLSDACPMQNVRALAFSPDNRELIVGTSTGLVHSYSRTSHQLTAKQFDLGGALYTIKFVNEGKQFIVVGASKLAIIEADTWRVLREIPLPEARRMSSADVNATGTGLLRSDWSAGGIIYFTDIQTGRTIRSEKAGVTGVAFLADGRHAAVINNSSIRDVMILDAPTQTQIRQLRGHLLGAHSASLSSDGQRLITGNIHPESAKIWDVRMDGMREVLNLSAPGNLFQVVGFSPDGNTVFAMENGGAVYFWRAPSWADIAAAESKEKMESERLAAVEAKWKVEASGLAFPSLVESSAANPEDTLLAMKVAALHVWFGQDAEYAAARQRRLVWAAGATDAGKAERTAKLACLRPEANPQQREAALLLARKGVELGKGGQYAPWHQLTLGMAEFRSGHYPEADAALTVAAQSASSVVGGDRLDGTADYFRAMSLFQQGKPAEARALFTATARNMMKPLPTADQDAVAVNEDQDVLILWLACKEARALLRMPAPTAKP